MLFTRGTKALGCEAQFKASKHVCITAHATLLHNAHPSNTHTHTLLLPQGPIDKVYKAALALGTANQLTNILRDVGEDIRERDRIYLPLDELKQFGITEEEVRTHLVVCLLPDICLHCVCFCICSHIDAKWTLMFCLCHAQTNMHTHTSTQSYTHRSEQAYTSPPRARSTSGGVRS